MPANENYKRKSNGRFQDNEAVSNKKMRMSMGNEENNERAMSPETLIHNLDDVISQILSQKDLPEAVQLELKGFDASTASMEEYNKKRDQIREMLRDSALFDKKMELNLEEATIASAKLEVDKRITTRRMSRKFHEECGVQESDILYKGLDYRSTEAKASKELRDTRTASIIESCVDFQKQIQWKMNVMNHVKAKQEQPTESRHFPKSDGPSVRTRGGQDRQRENLKEQKKKILEQAKNSKNSKSKDGDPFKTPQKKVEFNALDERRIIENYALEVASELRDTSNKNRRQIAPVPFNINILDDESDDEEVHEMEID
ncbi:unnamed protein product [Caenorhabditis angaria]|uniref:Uncharacterized protein n=1 Tax=Caenorhabditis angaria TaxID=860376 RepID=A0A9P1N2K0_9PELO|nr:unnamed protein product [Caenorhabditis angaria]